jgi:DNA-binding MarR family transcriptional regulator
MPIARPASTFMVRSSPGEPAIPVRRNALALARRFFQISVAMTADWVAEANLTPLQMGVLAYINKENGEPGIDQVGLAARLGIDRNNAGVIVLELEKRGLLERRVSKADRRARHLYLTPQGEKAYHRWGPNVRAAIDGILAPLAPRERELLLDLLTRVIQENAAYARPGGGRRRRRRET